MPVVPQGIVASPAPAANSSADEPQGSYANASDTPATATSSAKVAAGLRALELTPATIASTVSTLGPTAAVLVAAPRTAVAARRHAPKPTPAGTGGGAAPPAPSSPSPNAAGTGAGAASAGLSSGLWCVLFVVLLALVGRELRRHRVRPVLAGPVGVVSLLQRPG
jgi:hypothetical protein